MMTNRWPWMLLLMGGLAAGRAMGLELGDPAPEIAITKWIKGAPTSLKAGQGKNVFVIEFWATWCGPCRMSIPHLTELQHEYKDKGLIIVSITDEAELMVQQFVNTMGNKMDFTVAIDDRRATSAAYMQPFRVTGIPHAFVVDKAGKIAWHGHPGSGMDVVLRDVVAGTFSTKAWTQIPEYVQAVQKLDRAKSDADKEKASKKAAEIGALILKEGEKSTMTMDSFAWTILTSPHIKTRDLDLAMKAAQAAYDACKGKAPLTVDTYAKALFDNGKKADAVKYQEQAVALAKNEEPHIKRELKQRLDLYKKAATEKQ